MAFGLEPKGLCLFAKSPTIKFGIYEKKIKAKYLYLA